MPQDEIGTSCELLLQQNFKSFLLKVFYTTNPNVRYFDNWHIDLLGEYLKQAEAGKIKRLIINIPSRSLKSTIISVAWPAWLLGLNPARRIIVASYSQTLSNKLSLECKQVITSSWYRLQFPGTIISRGKNEKSKFVTTQNGFRFATSIGGTLTGEGADYLIIDDPHTPLQAASQTYRKRAIDWYDQTFSTRLNDKKKGVIVVLMQRLNQDDLSAHLLKQNQWRHLKLPAIAPNDTEYVCGSHKYTIPKGEPLAPAREGHKELKIAKEALGSYGFNAQYLQNPIPLTSGLLKYNWIKRYTITPKAGQIYQSWDCAVKAGEHNDYSVCTTWCIHENKFYLVDLYRNKLEFPALKKKTVELYNRFMPDAVIIEDKASGQPLIQELQENTDLPAIRINPCRDKETRFLSVLGLFEAGRVYLPQNSPWLAALEAELFTFPNTAHDDQVDSITQFLGWIKNKANTAEMVRTV